jgi:hypothetical protein
MSTNFYVFTMGDTTCESCGHTRADQKIDTHLGQRAAGWEFLYRADPNWTAETAYEEWTKRIRTGQIVDEYGLEYTVEDLLAEIAYCEPRRRRLTDRLVGGFRDRSGRAWSAREFC